MDSFKIGKKLITRFTYYSNFNIHFLILARDQNLKKTIVLVFLSISTNHTKK